MNYYLNVSMFYIQGCYDALEDKVFMETTTISIVTGLSTVCAVKKILFFIISYQ